MKAQSISTKSRTSKKTATKSEKAIDRICSVFAVFMPLTTLPQIHMLYMSQDASGLSLSMWVLYCIGVVPFLLFGIIHRHRQLVVLNTLWLLMQGVMIIGILLYR